MEHVVLRGVHKSFARRYGAPTLRSHHEKGDQQLVDEALIDVSLTVSSGEAIGILGLARSGRSTLLDVVSGKYRPDRGKVLVRGRATGLVAAGAGFSANVSVRGNLELNAAFLGTPPELLSTRMPDILAFAGLKQRWLDYPLREIDGPQRRRLAYAAAVASAPEVFLADRFVVVGGGLKERCLNDLATLRDSGHALVLATNNKPVLKQLCTRAIVLDGGRVVLDGSLRGAFAELRRQRRR